MEDENSLNNIKNNNNIQNYQENVNKASYISLLEKLNFQRDQAITNYSNLKIEYNNLKSKYEKSEAKLNALEADLRNTNSKFSFSEQKLHENIQNLFTTEKKLSEATNQKDFLKRNNDLLENQLSHCKSIYLDYKSRSEKELNILREDLDEIKNSDKDPKFLIENCEDLPDIYMACGIDDFLFEKCADFYKYLNSKGIEARFVGDEGEHTWEFCDKYIKQFIETLK